MTAAVITEWFRHVPEDKFLRDPAQGRADARAIWEALGLRPGCRVLECPCAKADIGFPLARLGAVIEGIDFNSHFVAAARNKFWRAGLPGTFRTGDMRTLPFPENMDAVINWSRSFGFFSDEGNEALLVKFFAALRPGGTLVIEAGNPDRVAAGLSSRLLATGETAEEQWDPQTRRASIVFPANAFRGPVLASLRVYSREEYRALLEKAGFAGIAFRSETFGEYSPETSESLVVTARRP